MTPTPVGVDDFQIRRIIAGNSVLSNGSPDLKEIGVQVKALGDHPDTVRIYIDMLPPLPGTDPGGCLPNGRILDTTITLDPAGASQGTADKVANVFGDTGTLFDGLVEFSCTNQSAVFLQTYRIVAVVDAHGDDSVACGPGLLQTSTCFNALADDDLTPTLANPTPGINRDFRDAPRVKK